MSFEIIRWNLWIWRKQIKSKQIYELNRNFLISKGYFCYKTITSQNMSSKAQVKNFDSIENLCSVPKMIKFLYFYPSHDLPNLWGHDEFYYRRQGTFLNISFAT